MHLFLLFSVGTNTFGIRIQNTKSKCADEFTCHLLPSSKAKIVLIK